MCVSHQGVCTVHARERVLAYYIYIIRGPVWSLPSQLPLASPSGRHIHFTDIFLSCRKTEPLFLTYQKFEIKHFLPQLETITHRDNRENSPFLSECAEMASPTAASQSQQTKKLFPPRTRRACDQCRLARCRCDGNRPWYARRPSSL